jgi:tRNA-dihydrouridine synthase B
MENHLLNSPFYIGSRLLSNRLVQGPLAGFSSAPMRALSYQFMPPAYAVSEMISAHDVVHKHAANSRYLYRSPVEKNLCYQLAGNHPAILVQAAVRLQDLGADLIDINCGCPKNKIRKKGAGSALLDNPDLLCKIVTTVRDAIQIPLTIKLRIQGSDDDILLAQALEQAGADALIIHGRRWIDDYDKPCDFEQIAQIKKNTHIPVIANGDIVDRESLSEALRITGCDALMLSRAGCGQPWIYAQLLADKEPIFWPSMHIKRAIFFEHLNGLAALENEYQAVLQSKKLVRYYFLNARDPAFLKDFYGLSSLADIRSLINQIII